MENQYRDESIFSLEVSPVMRADLIEAVKWGKFLAILGFVGTGLMVLGGVIAMTFSSSMGELGSAYNLFSGVSGFIFYLAIAALYFYPAFAMFKFCTLTKQGLQANNQPVFEEGISYLKRLLRYMGILTIVVLSFYLIILLFVFVILGASLGR